MPPDPPHVLLQKAHDDERLLLLASGESTISDEQIGFLAQQAVEKAIKAVLSLQGITYRRTHDLSELLDLLKKAGIEFPGAMESCILLTPFAAEMRYDYLPPEDAAHEPFDRPSTLSLVRTTLEWARAKID